MEHSNGDVSFGFCKVSESRNDGVHSITTLCSGLTTSTGQIVSLSSVRPAAYATDYCSLKAYCRPYSPSVLDVPTFAARCLHARNDARDPSSERCNYVGERVHEFCLNDDFHAI